MNLRNSLLMLFCSFLTFLTFIILPTVCSSQVLPTGRTQEASSQLIFWYDADDDPPGNDRETDIQITNTSSTTAVEIHVQIYQSTGDATDITNTTRCIDANFNDVLTPNDTLVYDLDGTIYLNEGELGTPAPINNVDGTKGFVVVTPVVGNGDNTAISFQHLIGTSLVEQDDDDVLYRVNAMGRDAVDLTNGQILADGITLDGVSTGFVMLQPSEVSFNLYSETNMDNIDIVAIVFADEYGPPGLLGYRAIPAQSTFSPFLFNFEEIPASCPIATNDCFNNWGLSADLDALNQLIDPGVNLCDAVVLSADAQGFFSGWTRFFVMGLDPNESQIVLNYYTGDDDDDDDGGGASWSQTNSQ